VRIGAVEGGSAAGAPDGSTHPIVERNDVTAQPAAGDVAPWQDAQCTSRMGATSVSKTGGTGGVVRSSKQPARSGQQTSARTTNDVRTDRAAVFGRLMVAPRYGRAKPGRVESDSARYES